VARPRSIEYFLAEAALVFDEAGNLYSTAAAGGPPATNGTVFRLKLRSDGSWTEKVLHSFDRAKAAYPVAGLVFDAAGNLYGTASHGGPADGGAVFKLWLLSGGGWAYSVLHVFLGPPALNPTAGVILAERAICTGRPLAAAHQPAVWGWSSRLRRSFKSVRDTKSDFRH